MFLAFSDAAWRVVLLLCLAVAPYVSPVDAVAATGPLTAGLRLAGFVVVVLALGIAAKRARATSRPLATALAGAPLVACLASVVFEGDRGPLGRGVWLVAPFVWAAIALVVSGPLAQRVRGGATPMTTADRGVILGIALGVGVLSFGVSLKRVGSRDALWNLAFAADPGNESAALATADLLRTTGGPRPAFEAERACVRARPAACRCEEAADADAIDLGSYADARTSLEAASGCARTPRRIGLMAEALVGTRALDEGIRQAEIAIASSPTEAHAAYARAWGTMLKGYPADARKFAEQAVALGRGLPANLLLGQIEFQLGDIESAAALFHAALKDDPNSVQANYDAALVAQKKNQYHDAREGYLRTLRLDPTYADAQYNLVLLTFNAGAVGEAQHRLEEMTRQCPRDRRLAELRRMLTSGAPQAP
jgi:tetratricopeptide (TPR) repeat protein